MDQGQFSRVSEGQRACLRLVLLHKTSKDIARELAISPHTVDQRIRTAIRVMGTTSRFEAARALALYENVDPYQAHVYQASHIEQAGTNADEGTPELMATVDAHASGGTLSVTRSWHPPFALFPGERNNLSVGERLAWIVIIAVTTALAFGAILAGLEALAKLV
jgi:DNA-binding CsgD family transcriptional regulator